MLSDVISKVILTEGEIKKRVEELGAEISRDYDGAKVLLVGILRGAFIFLADVARHLSGRFLFDFVSVSSYGLLGTESSGTVELLKGITVPVKGMDVLVVDDIVDSGLTTDFVSKYIKGKGASSVKLCALLDKPVRRKVHVNVDYVGFTVPDVFVVGYGLGYNDEYRNLPFVGVLRDNVWKT